MEQFLITLAGHIQTLATRLPNALLVLVIGFLVIQFILMIMRLALEAGRVTRAMREILLSVAATLLWIGVIALVFQSLGLNQIAIALSGSVAIIALGVATGANKLVADIFAGLFLARNRNFKIGQQVKIGDVEGKIHSLDSRKVRILGKSGHLYVIPNAKFDDEIWQVTPEGEGNK